jgi:hypothetical protein
MDQLTPPLNATEQEIDEMILARHEDRIVGVVLRNEAKLAA